ncbi:MAG: leucine--tRNA ligase [Bacteroidia bacterium]|jgi:leucyl-tRNA synthetase|nr:leucine--tRNA ligase [Bacteroidia bacterium]
MKEYDFNRIEQYWRTYWQQHQTYKIFENTNKPKCYVLDMFPYPSGAGLHVGHPLGYIASDIYSRYKRLKGYNVLHPMGYDSFGLPAEQYAIQTGQHPAKTTEINIARYREQLDKIGFCYDWDREVRTSDPNYYKWTQWIFIQLFNSWYNPITDKAEPIETLISIFETEGYKGSDDSILTGGIELDFETFTASDWIGFTTEKKQKVLLGFRLAYLSEAFVNWCPQLGTVLSNDEVKDGVSERGGYPVERKLMKQWSMRITAYAERLLNDLDGIDWTESLKEAQRNWIGKSQGASVFFKVQDADIDIEVFTTRPDTIFGVSYLAVAPEYEFLEALVTADHMEDVMDYVETAKNRSERERMADVKRVSGAFTGSYAIHPFTGKEVPVWVADYVLAGYGTGAVMGVPAHDSRDFLFAKHFELSIIPVVNIPSGHDLNTASYDAKEGKLINSDFLNGLEVKDAIKKAVDYIDKQNIGKSKTNYRLRDAIFGRQRYWGEPIPVYYKQGIPHLIPEDKLPLVLPEIDKFLPTADGEPPLARAEQWMWNEEKGCVDKEGYPIETTTMPGWAGSSWYFLRYMDPNNTNEFAGQASINYWGNVDLYMGGSEHATGHLLYVRFWTKFLYDRGYIPVQEPAKKLINQGMIQGRSNFVYRIKNTDKLVSFGLKHQYDTTAIHVDVNIVQNDVLDLDAFKAWREDFANAEFLLEDGKYICGNEIEKMSKSKHNVVTPDAIVEQYGADTLRLYEMFLGPLEQSKPWSTQGIEGVHRFLKKVWRLFFDIDGNLIVTDESADKKELKALHKLIKKVGEDIEQFSFNTSVSSFMICVNELADLKCNKREILEPFLICLHAYAPHITEELWHVLSHQTSITEAVFPIFKQEYLIEDSFSYPVSINGKHRTNIEFALTATEQEVTPVVLADEIVMKWLEGKTPKKVVFVKGKIINIVI